MTRSEFIEIFGGNLRQHKACPCAGILCSECPYKKERVEENCTYEGVLEYYTRHNKSQLELDFGGEDGC